jgi:D-cysteine desulfhydrase family pyridoxal phosphate-dependent enzyme
VALQDIPREPLGIFPTPLMRAARLTDWLGGPDIWIKRDDLTGLALGGNKIRKLEFLVADALRQEADTLITTGAAQSNHVRLTAAAARRVGLEPVLVLRRQDHAEPQGNVLLDMILGASIHWIDPGEDANAAMESIARDLRRQGHHPYVIPLGGSNGLGACGYAIAAREVHRQATHLGFAFDVVICAMGSGGTQAGLLLGQRLDRLPFQVWGVSVGPDAATARAMVAAVANDGARLVGTPPLSPTDVTIFDEYVGPGYGAVTPAVREAIHLLARLEAVLLDPVYTGKAMAGLIDLVKRRVLRTGQRVLFIHTGGIPALFAYHQELVSTDTR